MKEKYIRIGTQLYKVVRRPLISGDFIEEKVQWSYETLRQAGSAHYVRKRDRDADDLFLAGEFR